MQIKTVLIAPVLIWSIATLSLGSAFVFFLNPAVCGATGWSGTEPPSLENRSDLLFINYWKRNRLEARQDVTRSGRTHKTVKKLKTLKLFHGPDSLSLSLSLSLCVCVCCPEGKASHLSLFDMQNPWKNPISQSPSVLFFRTLAPIMHSRLPRIQNNKTQTKKRSIVSLYFSDCFCYSKAVKSSRSSCPVDSCLHFSQFLPVWLHARTVHSLNCSALWIKVHAK